MVYRINACYRKRSQECTNSSALLKGVPEKASSFFPFKKDNPQHNPARIPAKKASPAPPVALTSTSITGATNIFLFEAIIITLRFVITLKWGTETKSIPLEQAATALYHSLVLQFLI